MLSSISDWTKRPGIFLKFLPPNQKTVEHFLTTWGPSFPPELQNYARLPIVTGITDDSRNNINCTNASPYYIH